MEGVQEVPLPNAGLYSHSSEGWRRPWTEVKPWPGPVGRMDTLLVAE